RSAIPGLGRTDGMKRLRARAGRLRGNVQFLFAPVRRHLASVRIRVDLSTDRRIKHLLRRHPKPEHQRAVAIIREEPVVTGLHRKRGTDEHRLVPGTRYLEKDLVLALELDLLIVEPPRKVHRAIGAEEGLGPEALVFFS